MGFNKKLVVAGLAVGVTAYMLYRKSKKNQASNTTAPVPASMGAPNNPSQSSQPSHSSHWGGAALAGAGVAAAAGGAAYAAHHHHSQQQQQYAGVPSPHDPNLSWDALRDPSHITNLLATCVMDQYLYAFYKFSDIVRIAHHIASSGALAQCADAWQLPPFLAQDLVKLALFDVMFLLDDSASMRSQGTVRRDALAGILKRSADAAARFDPDGMEVAWMNSPTQARIHNVAEADALTSKCAYDGRATPMGASLESKILQPLVVTPATQGRLAKPALVLVITDGRPTGQSERDDKIVRVLKSAKKTLASTRYGEDAVSFQIATVGNDREAQDWLDSIDNDSSVGDLVDVCSDIAVESAQVKKSTGVELTQELYCLKLLLGPIDTSYDASDESNQGIGASKKARRRAEKREKDKREKEKRYASEMAQFRRERDAAMSGKSPVASAGGALAPQGVEDGYSHQPSYNYSQPPPAPQSGGYSQPPPQQGGYGQPYPPYPQQQAAYASPPQPYGAPPPQYPPPYPPAYPQAGQAPYGQRDMASEAPSSYAPAPPAFGGGFAMPTPQPGAAAFPDPNQQQHNQPQPPSAPFAFPQARPTGYY